MQRLILNLLVVCLLFGIAVIGYMQWSTPTPPPATVTPTATSQPTAIPTPEPAPILTTDQLALPPFTLPLGSLWSVLFPTDESWSAKLQQLASEKPMLNPYWTALAAAPDNETVLALTWPPTTTIDLLLVVARTSAEGLTLQSYLAATKEELAQSRLLLGAAVMVSQAEIRYDLRKDHIPAATIRYTLPAKAPNQVRTGYQVAMLDKNGDDLLLLTAITQDADPTKALTLIDSLVATIQEE